MKSRDFCYWLQGYFEIADARTINEKQTEIIKKHLNMVFAYEIDPSFGEAKEILENIHNNETPQKTSHSNPYWNSPRRIMC